MSKRNLQGRSHRSESEFEGFLAREETRLVEVANAFWGLIYKDLLEDNEDCSCNCTSTVECTVYYSHDDEELAKFCEQELVSRWSESQL